MAKSRQALADTLSVARDDIVYVPNATHGINIVARSLELHFGDEVLTTDHEYGAMDRTWRFLSQKEGFSYRSVDIPLPFRSDRSFVDHFFSFVSEKTRVIFISHITSPTALIFPVCEICERARDLNILTVIDGAHAPGQIDLNLEEIGVDFYSGNCHKWLCAPKGSAFLYAGKEVQSLIEPLVVSWGWQSDQPGPSQFIDYLEWTGTRDISTFLAIPAAIEFQQTHDWVTVHRTCHDLAEQAVHEITTLFGTKPLSNPDKYAQMVSIPLPNKIEPDILQQMLFTRYHIEVPVMKWKDQTLIRVSFQGYNTPEDLVKLVDALKEIYRAPRLSL
jgi:isopenicillin-N epimerase